MSQVPVHAHAIGKLSARDVETILGVTRDLAEPLDLHAMLEKVTEAACRVLRAERSSVWLFDASAGELVLKVSRDIGHVRIPLGVGLVGACARERAPINVPDCYADPRFDREIDRRSGFHTRCALTMPLIHTNGSLIGVMQVLNRKDGPFNERDEALAAVLAAQCAVALVRARMTEALVEGEKLRQELELARVVQMSSLPSAMPQLPGYDMHGICLPAEQTGGDTFDLALLAQGVLIVLGDAAGHGLAPALAVTQLQAMLRMAFRLGADLETAFRQTNDQLAATLPDGRFVTAFIGLLDAQTHRVRFLSGGQAPILHFRAEDGTCTSHKATSFPMGAMPLAGLRPAVELVLAPGDMLVLLTDGTYECERPDGTQFGQARVEQLLRELRGAGAAELARQLVQAVRAFAQGAPQEDDVTIVIVKRCVA
ncbi:MAG TPA: GAF domain-containing SpoIIE family protein phosphatase [Methylibium sp.]